MTSTCSVDGCNLAIRVVIRGLCNKHYQRWRTKGTTDSRYPDVTVRLLAKRVIDGDCWVWTGTQSCPGYGEIRYQGRRMGTHRAAYLAWVGPIPDGYEVDHVKDRGCLHTECFNPAHLEAVKPYVNNMRSASRASLNAKKTECKQGHPFDEANTYMRPKGRECRTCAREYQARRRAASSGT